jgi:hypothetical protein
VLGQIGDLLAQPAGPRGDRPAQDLDGPGGRPHQPDDLAQQRGLAGPVGSEDAHDLAAGEPEADPVVGPDPAAEDLGEPADPKVVGPQLGVGHQAMVGGSARPAGRPDGSQQWPAQDPSAPAPHRPPGGPRLHDLRL